MKHSLLAVSLFTFLVTSASATSIECKSANYIVIAKNIDTKPEINYGIDKKMNAGADVVLDKTYISNRIIAFSLEVDGQPGKFEVSTFLGKSGKYNGTIFYDKVSQSAKCTKR